MSGALLPPSDGCGEGDSPARTEDQCLTQVGVTPCLVATLPQHALCRMTQRQTQAVSETKAKEMAPLDDPQEVVGSWAAARTACKVVGSCGPSPRCVGGMRTSDRRAGSWCSGQKREEAAGPQDQLGKVDLEGGRSGACWGGGGA